MTFCITELKYISLCNVWDSGTHLLPRLLQIRKGTTLHGQGKLLGLNLTSRFQCCSQLPWSQQKWTRTFILQHWLVLVQGSEGIFIGTCLLDVLKLGHDYLTQPVSNNSRLKKKWRLLHTLGVRKQLLHPLLIQSQNSIQFDYAYFLQSQALLSLTHNTNKFFP